MRQADAAPVEIHHVRDTTFAEDASRVRTGRERLRPAVHPTEVGAAAGSEATAEVGADR
ncbi:hypothetical protein [Kitasatospora aureofaciens]|uniref:hypothetical protein n=1 Tax=Kitasatospora aureofaciens TaxID=1894 RepID=UPI0036F49651